MKLRTGKQTVRLKRDTSTAVLAAAGGVGLGAGLMYLLEPRSGRRRRSRLLDEATEAIHDIEGAATLGARDLANRAKGVAAGARARLRHEEVSDQKLHERVRACLGRCTRHARAIDVLVRDGVVTLQGPVLEFEADALVKAMRGVRGVDRVEDRLHRHESAVGVPALQGTGDLTWWPDRPTPAARFATTVAGVGVTGAAIYALGRRSWWGLPLLALGGGLLGRAATYLPHRRWAGLSGHRGIDFHKTIEIAAPVNEVYGFYERFENFPRFMEHVKDVSRTDGASHWKVAGPAGTTVEWDAEITRHEPDRVLAWKTLPGSTVQHAGIVRFESTPAGGTRLDVQLSYNPAAGAFGHAVAALFGKDPKSIMDADLLRLKSLLEQGRATAHGETVTKEELRPS